jgi:hypothetical protein
VSLTTPNGIQVQIDGDRIDHCIDALGESKYLDQILMDVDLWEYMPNAVSNVMAISAAVVTKAPFYIIIYGLVGYVLGTMIKVGRYSRFLKIVFPQVLGSHIISLIFALCAGLYLYHIRVIPPLIVLFLVVTNNGMGHLNLLEVLTAPIRRFAQSYYMKSHEMPYTHVERTFITLCNDKARGMGITLNWNMHG